MRSTEDKQYCTPVSNLTSKDRPTSPILSMEYSQVRRQRDREWRRNLTTEQTEEINARRRASDKTRRMTPCHASIAMPRPGVTASVIANPAISTHTSPAPSPHTSPSVCRRNSAIETDGNYLCIFYSLLFDCLIIQLVSGSSICRRLPYQNHGR